MKLFILLIIKSINNNIYNLKVCCHLIRNVIVANISNWKQQSNPTVNGLYNSTFCIKNYFINKKLKLW